jgi:hypothetical protein
VAEDLVDRQLTGEAQEAQEQEVVEARKAGVVGFSARVFAQVGLPHKATDQHEFVRRNGDFTLSIMSPAGIPYGSIPRLILCHIATEAVRRKSPEIELGDSLSEFLHRLGMVASGGPRGYIGAVRKQAERLFSSAIVATEHASGGVRGSTLTVASHYQLWWGTADDPRQRSLWESRVTLSQEFFHQIVSRPVPVDMRALKNLRQSPLELDLYVWLTHRMSYLTSPTKIPWALLQYQFGSDYGRLDHFRTAAVRALAAVHREYPEADFEVVPGGLLLRTSPTHISFSRSWRPRTRRLRAADEVAPTEAPAKTDEEMEEIIRLAQNAENPDWPF